MTYNMEVLYVWYNQKVYLGEKYALRDIIELGTR